MTTAPALAALSLRLREATAALHRQAEGSGIMRDLLRGDIDIGAYRRLLRNLHALYASLERGLDANATALAPIRIREVYRAAALADDLRFHCGEGWAELALTTAMTRYRAHIDALSEGAPALLAAHAYVRYLGDLSGGRILGATVARALAAGDAGMAFYDFPALDPDRAKARLRAGLDALPLDAATADAIVIEARDAFARHIELFEELAATPRDG